MPDSPDSNDDSMLVLQAHSPENGDTYPPYSLSFTRQGADSIYWTVTWNSLDPSQWGSDSSNGRGQQKVHVEPLMPEGAWYRYILHYRAARHELV